MGPWRESFLYHLTPLLQQYYKGVAHGAPPWREPLKIWRAVLTEVLVLRIAVVQYCSYFSNTSKVSFAAPLRVPPPADPKNPKTLRKLCFKNTQSKIHKISFSFKLGVLPVNADIVSEFGRKCSATHVVLVWVMGKRPLPSPSGREFVGALGGSPGGAR